MGDAFVQPGTVVRLQRDKKRIFSDFLSCSSCIYCLRRYVIYSVQRLLICQLIRQLKRRQRLARDAVHLQGALQPLGVVGLQSGGADGVYQRQLRMHGRPAQVRGFLLQGRADGRIGTRHVVQPFKQCLEVQHGTADQQRRFAARGDLGHQARGVSRKFGGRVGM